VALQAGATRGITQRTCMHSAHVCWLARHQREQMWLDAQLGCKMDCARCKGTQQLWHKVPTRGHQRTRCPPEGTRGQGAHQRARCKGTAARGEQKRSQWGSGGRLAVAHS